MRGLCAEVHTRGVKGVLLTLLTVASLVASGVGAATPDAKPALTVVDRSPLVVRGTAFEPRLRVVVIVSSDAGSARRTARPGLRGAFTVRFDAIRLDPCTGGMLVALGAAGDFARLKIGLRECPGPAF